MAPFALTREHGFAAGVGILSALHLLGLGIFVASARRKAAVPYPYVYAERAEAEEDPLKNIFNCTQRAHQNTLEGYPIFIVLFGIASIEHPLYAAISGLVWLAGRHAYASGYATGDPSKRTRGNFGYFGSIALLGLAVKTAATLALSA
nr:Microsomal glutathione S-transferase 3 [Polyrhizophydium stewartii]